MLKKKKPTKRKGLKEPIQHQFIYRVNKLTRVFSD
jgi:hypothetical protein